MLDIFGYILQFIFFLLLPFFVLMQVGILMHGNYGLNAFLALGIGAAVTAILLFLYFTYWYGLITGRTGRGNIFLRRWILVALTLGGICGHMLFFAQQDNFKSPEVKAEFYNLHPILRVGVSSLVYFDQESVVTDLKRIPSDYEKMGLPQNENSLHYPQEDGYVYAVDLRTKNRSFARNWLVKAYFRLMGFRTLRHTGTEDHLHISL